MEVKTGMSLGPQPEQQTQLESTQETPEPQTLTQLESTQETSEPQTLNQLESTKETSEPQTLNQLESTKETSEPQTLNQLESTQETPEPQTLTQLESTQETTELQTINELESSQETSEPQTVTQVESTQQTTESQTGPVTLAHIEFRIQALENRRQLLLQQQHFYKKDNSDGTISQVSRDESDDTSELETIQKELEVLQNERRCKLKKEGRSLKPIADSQCQQLTSLNHLDLKPQGGVYILPPLHAATQQRGPQLRDCDTVPVYSLGKTADVVKCPSCQEVVLTETCKKAGETVWTVCCLCSMIGCVAGCCLIPFFMDILKNIKHKCPQCKAHIHTKKPF